MDLATVKAYKEQIRAIVLAHHAANVRLFGSVLRGDNTSSSDIDFLIEPTEETSLMDVGAMRHELKALLGVKVAFSRQKLCHTPLEKRY